MSSSAFGSLSSSPSSSLEQHVKSGSRIITAVDVGLFASMTWAGNPLFLSLEAAKKRGLEERLVPAHLTLSMMIGLLYHTHIFDRVTILSRIDIRYLSRIYVGDEIEAEAGVVLTEKSEESGRDHVIIHITGRNVTRNAVCVEGDLHFLT